MIQQSKKKKVPVPFAMRMVPKVFPVLEKIAPFLSNRFGWWLFFTPMRFPAPAREREAASKAKINSFVIDGKKLTYYSWGNGPIILMMHGWAGRGTQFQAFIEPFAKAGYKVVALDGPAHGKSEGKSTNVLEFAAAIEALSNILGPIESFVGHSFGGITGLYAIKQGLKVRTLISIGSPTEANMLLSEFLSRINGSETLRRFIEQRIVKRVGIEFRDVSIQQLLRHVPGLDYLNIHDSDDKEVSVSHQNIVSRDYPHIKTLTTNGLGHMRILKNAEVISTVVSHIMKQKTNKKTLELVA